MPMFIYQNPKDFFYVAHKCEETPNIGHFFGHTHDHYEVFLFLKGDASFNVEGNIFKLSQNDIILIPPHQYHCLILDRLAVYERYVIEIPLDRVPSALKEIFEKTEICNVTENTPLIDLFYRLDTYHSLLNGEDFGKICRHMVQELLLVLKIYLGRGDNRHSYDPLTKRILTYINDNLTTLEGVDEVARHNPTLPPRALFLSGIRIGRAVVGTMTTTLLLAYSGGYLTLLMMFAAQGTPPLVFLNSTLVSAEMVKTLVGSFGLVLVAPFTAFAAAILSRFRPAAD